MTEVQLSEHAPFDRRAVALHRRRAAPGIGRVTPVLEEFADRLLERLDDVRRPFSRALDVGGRGAIAPRLQARGTDVVALDLAPGMPGTTVVGDEERLPFADGVFDLVVANLSLHWANDLPGVLIQLRRALRPDGLMLASLPVLDTGGDLRRALLAAEADLRGGAAPRVSPMPMLADCAALLQRAGFALPVADAERLMLSYADPFDIVRDLRAAGETNALALRDRTSPPRALLPLALSRLPERDGRIPVTLEVAMLTGWAPA